MNKIEVTTEENQNTEIKQIFIGQEHFPQIK
jgi:hypothetical protein